MLLLLLLFSSDLLFPQEFVTISNEMPLLLAVIATSLLRSSRISLSMIAFLKSLSNPAFLDSMQGISNLFVRLLCCSLLQFKCTDFSIEHRRLQGVDTLPH